MSFKGFYFQFDSDGSRTNLLFHYFSNPAYEGEYFIVADKSFNSIFDTLLVDCALKFHDQIFLPNRTFEVVSKTVDGTEKFFLALNSVDIEEVFLQHDLNNPYIIKVLDRGTIYLLHGIVLSIFCR
jgi:hypothetical protein